MRPHRLRAVALGGARQLFGDLVERLLPRDRHKRRLAGTLLTDPAQRMREAGGMMLALGFERAGARAIVRTDAWDDVERQGSAPLIVFDRAYKDGLARSITGEDTR